MTKMNPNQSIFRSTAWRIIIVIIACIITIGIYSSYSRTISNRVLDQALQAPASSAHSPILITSYTDLLSFPGSGTKQNPFKIQDFDINASSSGYAIQIMNVNYWILIRNCTLHDSSNLSPFACIRLENCQNVNISKNIITSNKGSGISLSFSSYNTIENNTIAMNTGDGIALSNSGYNNITGNTASCNSYGIDVSSASNHNNVYDNIATYNNYAGIYLTSNYNLIVNNTLSENEQAGVHLIGCGSNTIADNSILSNHYFGLRLEFTNSINIISDNKVISNYIFGIYLYSMNYTRILRNHVNHTDVGIYLHKSFGNTFSSNNASMNDYYGIQLLSSSNNTFWGNGLWCNRINNSIEDATGTNKWDNGTRGNYWDDYTSRYPNATNNGEIWDTPYAIPGGTIAQDSKPLIEVPGNVAPMISSDPFINYTYGKTGNAIVWEIQDSGIGEALYSVYENGAFLFGNTWFSGMIRYLDVDYLPIGVFNYTIIAYDGLGGRSQNTVLVSVLNVAPAINHPLDLSYIQGSTGHFISWTVSDASRNVTSYLIARNGTSVQNGSWSYSPITCNVTGLSVGIYNYTIFVSDGYGGYASDVVMVSVVPNLPPVISGPGTITITHGSWGNEIRWIINDTTIGLASYSVFRDNALIQNGTWADGSSVVVDIDYYSPGNYNFTIIIVDGLGMGATDEVQVVILPENSPGIDGYSVQIILLGVGIGLTYLSLHMRRRVRAPSASAPPASSARSASPSRSGSST